MPDYFPHRSREFQAVPVDPLLPVVQNRRLVPALQAVPVFQVDRVHQAYLPHQVVLIVKKYTVEFILHKTLIPNSALRAGWTSRALNALRSVRRRTSRLRIYIVVILSWGSNFTRLTILTRFARRAWWTWRALRLDWFTLTP
jgi:hypothetical protein